MNHFRARATCIFCSATISACGQLETRICKRLSYLPSCHQFVFMSCFNRNATSIRILFQRRGVGRNGCCTILSIDQQRRIACAVGYRYRGSLNYLLRGLCSRNFECVIRLVNCDAIARFKFQRFTIANFINGCSCNRAAISCCRYIKAIVDTSLQTISNAIQLAAVNGICAVICNCASSNVFDLTFSILRTNRNLIACFWCLTSETAVFNPINSCLSNFPSTSIKSTCTRTQSHSVIFICYCVCT